MKKLFTLVFACFCLSVNAQVNESQNFVYLYSDSILYAENIRIRSTIFNSLQVRMNSKPIAFKQVKFIKNDEGFFANTSRLNAFGSEVLAVRVIQGKINLFEQRTPRTYNELFNTPFYRPHGNAIYIRMLYNKGYDNLKKVTYKNLKLDMADDALSLNLLEGYKKNINTGRLLYVVSGASITAALISFIVKGTQRQESFMGNTFNPQFPDMNRKPKNNFTTSIVLIGLGAGFAIGGYSVNQSGLKKLEASVDSYNR